MKFAKVTARLDGLGSEKWAVHIEGKRRAAQGEPMIFLSIGEPDAPPPVAILDEANRQMRAGRIRYAEGRGEGLEVAADRDAGIGEQARRAALAQAARGDQQHVGAGRRR